MLDFLQVPTFTKPSIGLPAKKRSVVEGSARGITVAGCFAMKSHRVKTFRDLNHDGKIDLKEMEKKYSDWNIATFWLSISGELRQMLS